MDLPTISIKGKDYVLVKERILAFNELYPNGSIRTEQTDDERTVKFRAIVTPDIAKPERFFTGHSEAVRGSSGVNATAACENCETSAVGRALGMMGIGIIDSIASADEVQKAIAQPHYNSPEYRDIPVHNAPSVKEPEQSFASRDWSATAKQKKLIKDLAIQKDRPVPDEIWFESLTMQMAKASIEKLMTLPTLNKPISYGEDRQEIDLGEIPFP